MAVLQKKDERSFYLTVSFFLYVFLLILTAKILFIIVNICYLGAQPAADITIVDTGFSRRFDLLIGYAQCGFDHLPHNGSIPNPKIFAIAFLTSRTLFFDLPILAALNYFRKFLSSIHHSYSPFVKESAHYTACIGKILIAMGLLSEFFLQMVMGLLSYAELSYNNSIQFLWIFAGAVILLYGDMFLRGCALQQDADETL